MKFFLKHSEPHTGSRVRVREQPDEETIVAILI